MIKNEIENSGKRVHSLQIVMNNDLICEEYFSGAERGELQNLYSCTKSISSLLVGVALELNPKYTVNSKVSELLPEYKGHERFENLTLEHFLSQTTGIKWAETGRSFAPGHSGFDMEQTDDWLQYLFEQPMTSEPGKRFNYNTGVSHALPLLASRIAGVSVKELLEKQLFEPLAISDYKWDQDPQGNFVGGKGLYLSAETFRKIGELVLEGGTYAGRQVISKRWLEESLSLKAKGHMYYGKYGYQWWLKNWPAGPDVSKDDFNIKCAIGFGGQFLFLIPKWNAFVVFTGNLVGAENFEFPQALLREKILPFLSAQQGS